MSPLPIRRILQPVSDPEKLYHFKPVNKTPTTLDDNGKLLTPDYFQPRANIKKLVSEGALSSKEEIEQFLRKFAREPHFSFFLCGARLGQSLHCAFAGFENSAR